MDDAQFCETCGALHTRGDRHQASGEVSELMVEVPSKGEHVPIFASWMLMFSLSHWPPAFFGLPDVISFTISYAGHHFALCLPRTEPLSTLVAGIEETTAIPRSGQKLLLKGKVVLGKEVDADSRTLEDAGIRQGSKLLLIGT